MLKLETEAGGTISDPNRSYVSEALRSLDGDGNNFVILSRRPNEYVQASGSAHAGLQVEHHDPATDDHFHATDQPSLAQAQQIFEDFRSGGQIWKTMTTWNAMDLRGSKRGCAGGAAAVLLIVLGGSAALTLL